MAVLVGATIVGSGTGSYFVLNVVVGVVSLGLVPLLVRWPVPAAVLLSLLAGGQQFGDPGPDLGPPGVALRHEGVQGRLAERLVAECPGEVQHRVTDPDPDPGAAVLAIGENAVRQVRQPERRPGRQFQPAGGGQPCSPGAPSVPSVPSVSSSPLRCRMVSPT